MTPAPHPHRNSHNGREWIAGPVFLGAVLLLLIVPRFALIALVWVVALAGVVALAALAGAMLAMPGLLVRPLRRRLAKRRRSTEARHRSPDPDVALAGPKTPSPVYAPSVEDPLALDPLTPDPLSPIVTRPIGDSSSQHAI